MLRSQYYNYEQTMNNKSYPQLVISFKPFKTLTFNILILDIHNIHKDKFLWIKYEQIMNISIYAGLTIFVD
jgi:hypothetical protein